MSTNSKKIVVVGDGNSGKTSLVLTLVANKFPTEDVPKELWEPKDYTVKLGEQSHALKLYDSMSPHSMDRIRRYSYLNADIVIVCFKITSPKSFENLKSFWLPELQVWAQGVPFLIVGTQTDLRDNPEELERLRSEFKRDPISAESGKTLARELGAVKYLECSALTQDGLKDVFKEATATILSMPVVRKKPSKCIVM